MNTSFLVKTVERDCPICDKDHILEYRKRLTRGLVKEESVEYEQFYFLCTQTQEEEDEFVSAELMDENLLRARDSYRQLKGLLTSTEISDIRSYYKLSQSDFSALLGWGDITVTRYESKTIQDETYDHIMRMEKENPLFAFECLNKHRSRFQEDKYNRIRKNIVSRVDEIGNAYLKRQEIISLYVNYLEESVLNGFKLLDINKVANVIGYFSQFVENLYKVKLMKLLWYTDAAFFKKQGKAMTGLIYKHMPFGALPIAYNEIIYLPTVKVVEEMLCEDISYKICPNEKIDISNFTLEELSVLEIVATTFKNYKSKEIVDCMHKEKAYTNTAQNQIIPFSLVTDLRSLVKLDY